LKKLFKRLEKPTLLGDKYLENSQPNDAIRAYEKVGAKEKLIFCEDKCLENGWRNHAIKAYEKAVSWQVQEPGRYFPVLFYFIKTFTLSNLSEITSQFSKIFVRITFSRWC